MLKKAFIVILFLSTASFGQYWSMSEQLDAQNTNTLNDTKILQQYYQNMFQVNMNETKQQLTPDFGVDKDKLLEKLRQSIPADGAIDQNLYFVGPGDLLQINILGEVPYNFTLPINPEGNISIPNFGLVNLKDKNLREAKELIVSKLKENILKGDLDVSLLSPRLFSVSVSGVVKNPGSYFASSVQRVESVVYQANLSSPLTESNSNSLKSREERLINQPDYMKYFNSENLNSEKTKMSFRNIKLIRQNGDTLNVDLIKYYASGDKSANPYLREGDRIIVPNYYEKNNTLSISGAVVLQGTYEYNHLDSIKTMISIAQGTNINADPINSLLFRYDSSSNSYVKIIFNLNKIINGESKNFALFPGDRVVIPEKFSENKFSSISIKGEVSAPGVYPIIVGKTSLLDIIKMCGGFTSYAALSEAKIIRILNPIDKTLENPDYERLINMRLSDMDVRERQYFNFESTINRKFVSIDFSDLITKKDSTQNINLQENDIIIVPKKMNAIYVYGQVVRPGYLNFTPNFDVQKYIDLAGGTTVLAKESEIRIIKAGSKNWLEPDETKLQPGDAIWVPRERDTDFEYYFNWFSRIVAVLGGIATIILLVTK